MRRSFAFHEIKEIWYYTGWAKIQYPYSTHTLGPIAPPCFTFEGCCFVDIQNKIWLLINFYLKLIQGNSVPSCVVFVSQSQREHLSWFAVSREVRPGQLESCLLTNRLRPWKRTCFNFGVILYSLYNSLLIYKVGLMWHLKCVRQTSINSTNRSTKWVRVNLFILIWRYP